MKIKIIGGDLYVGEKIWKVTGETTYNYWIKRGFKEMLIKKELVEIIKG